MPSNVAAAAPVTVLPKIIALNFTRIYERPAHVNQYMNGECQTGSYITYDRGRWRFTGRLTNTLRQALRAFYIARSGSLEPFYLIDPWETSPAFTYDPEDTYGRHTVRFDCGWQDALELGRSNVDLELVEIA
jgi:hypothetical protein